MMEGAILGCGLVNFMKEDGKPDTPKNRLYRILMSESAHLIWVLRCERRTQNNNQEYSERAVHKWYKRINDQMQLDCLLMNKYLFERKALKTWLVRGTWAKCSTNEDDLHRDWCRHPGVLVGKDLGHNRRDH